MKAQTFARHVRAATKKYFCGIRVEVVENEYHTSVFIRSKQLAYGSPQYYYTDMIIWENIKREVEQLADEKGYRGNLWIASDKTGKGNNTYIFREAY